MNEFRTTIGFDPKGVDSLLYRLLGANSQKRTYSMLRDGQLRQRRTRELVRNGLLTMPFRVARRSAEGDGPFNVDWVARGLDRRSARTLAQSGLFYGYSGYAHEQAAAARSLGVPALIEAQHALWRTTERISAAERERSPEWAATVPDIPAAQKRDREDAELAAATGAVSPSGQVSDSIRDAHPHLRIVEAPYGCPAPVEAPRRPPSTRGRPTVLFVGRVVALKGVADLLTLVKALGDSIDFTVIGPVPNLQLAAIDDLLSRVDYLGTMPRSEVLRQMAAHDLMVAPSLVEGRSLSVLEAVGQGTPIVVTPGTGADDLAAAGAGVVVPAASPQRLIDVVDDLLANPHALAERREAVLEVAGRSGWQGFEAPILAEVRSLLVRG